MADDLLTAPPLRRRRDARLVPVRMAARWRLLPWWLRVVIVFAVSRAVTTALMLVLASVQGANPWTGDHPAYLDFASIWDGRWYDIVAVAGYPAQLPMTADGHVGENAWAFMPGYPFLVRVLMLVSNQPWSPVAVFVSLAFGLGTALLFYRLLIRHIDTSSALFAVTLFCFAPLSPMMQVAYAESMYLFLLTLALLLLDEHRYVLLLPVIGLMAFTRPSGLAFALAIGLHVLYRWVRRRRHPFPPMQMLEAAGAMVFSLLAGLAWPLIAWVATGDMSAYTDTELAWRMPYIGYVDLVPFTAWFQGAHWWIVFALAPGAPEVGKWVAAIIIVVLLIVAFVVVLFLPAVRRLGVDIRFWLASYGLYLLAVFFPQSSTFRLLMPMFPLLGAVAQPRSRVYRIALVVIAVALQWGWLLIAWGVDGADWSPP
ncbi:hypothetical protein [Glaciibacter flavus]|uniref:hypothetical protein n=1 Tax=Orlajensenia flava TaxID=2565934 RepID=UPI003AFFA786